MSSTCPKTHQHHDRDSNRATAAAATGGPAACSGSTQAITKRASLDGRLSKHQRAHGTALLPRPLSPSGSLAPHNRFRPHATSRRAIALATEEASAKIGAHDRNAHASDRPPRRQRNSTPGSQCAERSGAAAATRAALARSLSEPGCGGAGRRLRERNSPAMTDADGKRERRRTRPVTPDRSTTCVGAGIDRPDRRRLLLHA